MKTKLILGSCALLVWIVGTSCHRKTYSESDVKAKLVVGMSKQSLISAFGKPTFEESQGQDLILTYLSDDGHRSGHRFTGFTVLVQTNTVVKWLPIHAGTKSE